MLLQTPTPALATGTAPYIERIVLDYNNSNIQQQYTYILMVVRSTWALKPGLTDRLVVDHNVTLTLTLIIQVGPAGTSKIARKSAYDQYNKEHRYITYPQQIIVEHTTENKKHQHKVRQKKIISTPQYTAHNIYTHTHTHTHTHTLIIYSYFRSHRARKTQTPQ
jgi:hypothetical protein